MASRIVVVTGAKRFNALGHPGLATDLHAWAAYLRGEAASFRFPVIVTSWHDIKEATDALVPYVIPPHFGEYSKCRVV
jgi:hypothetical protein